MKRTWHVLVVLMPLTAGCSGSNAPTISPSSTRVAEYGGQSSAAPLVDLSLRSVTPRSVSDAFVKTPARVLPDVVRAIWQVSAASAERSPAGHQPPSTPSAGFRDAIAASAAAAVETGIAAPAASAPGVPLIHVSVNGTSVTISWTPSSSGDATTSFVLRYSGPGISGEDTVSGTTLTFSGVSAGQYQVQVCAINSAGRTCSVPAAGEFTVVAAPAVPNAPSQLGYSLDGNIVTISWLIASTGPPPIAMVLFVEGLGEFPVGLSGGLTTAGPMPPGSYTVRLVARNASGDSTPAGPISIVVPCTTPAAPALSHSVSGSSVTLTWSSGSPKIYTPGYVVTISGPTPTVAPVADGTFTFTASSLQPGDYTASVKTVSGGTCADSPASTVSFSVAAPNTGTFAGTFSATGTNSRGDCTWRVTISGSATLSVTLNDDGSLSGTLRVSGNYNVPDTTTPAGGTCRGGSVTFNDTGQISGSPDRFTTTVTTTHTKNTAFGGSFLSPTLAIGTLTQSYTPGTGSIVMPVTLRR